MLPRSLTPLDRRNAMRGMLLWPLWRAGQARADDPRDADDARRSIGMFIGSWRQGLQRDAQLRGLATPSDTQRDVLQLLVHRSLQDRAALSSRLGRLPADADDARALAAFLRAWPDEALPAGVIGAGGDHRLDRDLKALARHFPDRSGGWRTLFPFFRP